MSSLTISSTEICLSRSPPATACGFGKAELGRSRLALGEEAPGRLRQRRQFRRPVTHQILGHRALEQGGDECGRRPAPAGGHKLFGGGEETREVVATDGGQVLDSHAALLWGAGESV